MRTFTKIIISILLFISLGCVEIKDYPLNIVYWELCYKVGAVEYEVLITGSEDSYYILYKDGLYNSLNVYVHKNSIAPILNYKTKKELEVVYFRQRI